MTEQEINIKIAEACGWKPDNRGVGMLSPQGSYEPIPDYCNDLNAMHEAESYASDNLWAAEQWMQYAANVQDEHPTALINNDEDMMYEVADLIHASARFRALAFIKTIEA